MSPASKTIAILGVATIAVVLRLLVQRRINVKAKRLGATREENGESADG